MGGGFLVAVGEGRALGAGAALVPDSIGPICGVGYQCPSSGALVGVPPLLIRALRGSFCNLPILSLFNQISEVDPPQPKMKFHFSAGWEPPSPRKLTMSELLFVKK